MSELSQAVVEAARFYEDCVKKAQDSVIEWDALPFNQLLNVQLRIMEKPTSHNNFQLIGGFVLNGQTVSIDTPIQRNCSPQDLKQKICDIVAKKIASILSEYLLSNIK